jgi:alpha-N-acetylglucosamine transferase
MHGFIDVRINLIKKMIRFIVFTGIVKFVNKVSLQICVLVFHTYIILIYSYSDPMQKRKGCSRDFT